eukprot:8420777-Lingulodinium_polyedra.AAC.1
MEPAPAAPATSLGSAGRGAGNRTGSKGRRTGNQNQPADASSASTPSAAKLGKKTIPCYFHSAA